LLTEGLATSYLEALVGCQNALFVLGMKPLWPQSAFQPLLGCVAE
jgi:hypothetical protein